MKYLLLTLLVASAAFANSLPQPVLDFYQPEFELISIEPMCPPSVPGAASCMAIGTVAKVRAYVGCLGEKAFFDAQVRSENGLTNIYINALAKTNSDLEARVRCIRAQTIVERIILPSHYFGEVKVINQKIDTL